MSANLVDLVLKQIGGSVPGILGALIGEGAERTQQALAGAVPAVLGGLIGAASKGNGSADQLVQAIGEQDDSLLDSLPAALDGGRHQELAEKGSALLTSLLGDGVIGSLVGAVGKSSGLGSGSTKSLLGMLTPIVIAAIRRQQREQKLDAEGALGLLMNQKSHVEDALPAGMASALGGGGLLDSLMGSKASTSETISEALGTTAGAAGEVAGAAALAGATETGEKATADAVSAVSIDAVASDGKAADSDPARSPAAEASAAAIGAADPGRSWLRWFVPLLILIGLLWFAFTYLGGDPDIGDAAGDSETVVPSATD